MPGISVSLLRWLLAAGNVFLLGLVAYVAVDFFQLQGLFSVNEGKGLSVKLPSADSVKVNIPRKPEAVYPQLAQKLDRQPPVKRTPAPPPPPPPPKEIGLLANGPLEQWELMSVIVDPSGEGSVAFIVEGQEETTARPNNARRARGRANARRNSRAPRRGRGAAAAGGPAVRSLYVGSTFRECEIDQINEDPPQVIYTNSGKQYVLEQDVAESRFVPVVVKGRTVAWELQGIDEEEELALKALEEDGGAAPQRNTRGKRGAQSAKTLSEAIEAIPEEDRGAIESVMKGESGEKLKRAQDNRQKPKPRANQRQPRRQPRAQPTRKPAQKTPRKGTSAKPEVIQDEAEIQRRKAQEKNRRRGANERATIDSPRIPGRAVANKNRQPGPETEEEKAEAIRLSEMTQEERERLEEEQQLREEDDQ